MTAAGTRYCIDTSALIAAWDERYPIENFPPLWDRIEELGDAKRLWVPEAVLDETSKRSSDLNKWLKSRGHLVVGFEQDVQATAREVLRDFPRLVAERKARYAADPFVIATARSKGMSVLTEEYPTNKLQRPNIPDVCRVLSVPCVRLIDVIRAEKWIIGS
ncbi:DUF4411 family protein [Hyphomonas sp. CACIAM 19H1]|uniref:DUF4411 family protein n=1 Tax=Hyphomonas sp. CACIAM 19H1 TaxID=1873716 RepID=UPI0013B06445|nr:DUF4411 family protein [Hyphomonas sp. CACIAM 19H1]